MSGHSKWATTKRQKATVDARKGAVFTKIANLITIVVKEKGANPEVNFALRMAMEKARAANMPKDNIERAVKRGTGELAGEQIEELIYEGFGPAQSQFILKCLTDSKNRTAAEIRHILSKHGGALGAVMWNFKKTGVIRIADEEWRAKNTSLNNIELELIDAGADDIKIEEEGAIIFSKPEDLQKLKQFLDLKGVKTEAADIEYVAKEQQKLSTADAQKVQELINELEENEDVSGYYNNVNL
jgi:YebC/PmpR family DNA-binding regulatory protein